MVLKNYTLFLFGSSLLPHWVLIASPESEAVQGGTEVDPGRQRGGAVKSSLRLQATVTGFSSGRPKYSEFPGRKCQSSQVLEEFVATAGGGDPIF
jgi:hypothetical protein